jgi:hypothetical protein
VRDVERREENVTMKDLEALVKSVRERIQAEADGRYLVISRVTDSVTGQDVFEECVHDTDDVQEATLWPARSTRTRTRKRSPTGREDEEMTKQAAKKR